METLQKHRLDNRTTTRTDTRSEFSDEIADEAEAEKLLERWLNRYTSPHTRDSYQHSLRFFRQYCEHYGYKWWGYDREQGQEFPAWLVAERGLAPGSISIRIAAVSAWQKWLVGMGLLPYAPMSSLRRVVPARVRPRLWLSEGGLKSWARAMTADGHWILAGLLLTGMRATEARIARIENLTFKRDDKGIVKGLLEVIGKGDKPHLYRLKPGFARRLMLQRDAGFTEGLLIPSPHNGRGDTPYSRQGIAYICQQAAGRAGLKDAESVTPHTIRRSVADRLLEESGGSLKYVKEALNHASIATTSKYLLERDLWDDEAFRYMELVANDPEGQLDDNEGLRFDPYETTDTETSGGDGAGRFSVPSSWGGDTRYGRAKHNRSRPSGKRGNPWGKAAKREADTRTALPLPDIC